MDSFASALAVLSAMITPALLISACGTLVLSTSVRLGRVVDHVRDLSNRFEQSCVDTATPLLKEKRAMIMSMLEISATRARLLQRSLMSLYFAIGVFVLTTVVIGSIAAAGLNRYSWAAVVLGLVGSICLCYGSITLIVESRLALASTREEMDFLRKLSRHYADHS